MARTYPYITGPKEGHAHQGVKTAAQYLHVQAHYLKEHRDKAGHDAVPHEATAEERAAASAPQINMGQWVIRCACNNAPSASFEWDLACCFECGAIYRELAWPADRVAIEAVLVKRRRQKRNWEAPETLADLISQNIANGDEVPV